MSLLTRTEGFRAAQFEGTPTTDQQSTMDEIVAAVDVVIEGITGPMQLAPRTFTALPKNGALILPFRSASITSITLDGVTISASNYDADTGISFGLIRPALGYSPWSYGSKVVVTALVGSASLPANVKLAAMFLAGHLWQIMQQGGRGAYADEIAGMSAGYAIPNRVRELLAVAPDLPGFA